MNGDTLYIGDSFDRISKFVTMEQFWYSDGFFSGKTYQSGYYWGHNRGISHLQFNYENKLTNVDMATKNRDTISPKEHFAKITNIFIKYYGNNYKVYKTSYSSARVLLWMLPDDNTLYLSGNLNNHNMNGNDSTTIFIYFNHKLNPKFYHLDTSETAKDLGLE